MAEINYLIPEPTEQIKANTNGVLLYSANGNVYAYKLQDDVSDWWAIGMVAPSQDGYWFPCIVSNSEKHAASLSIAFDETTIGTVHEVTYSGKTYYASFAMQGAQTFAPANSIIPVADGSKKYSDKDLTDIATATIGAYINDGGELPGVPTYKTSWVRKLINGVWQKTFAFAHAKTVYTDYANKKTLADKLEEIDTSLNSKISVVDSELSDTSKNPVQNKVVKAGMDALDKRISDNGYGVAGGKNLLDIYDFSFTNTSSATLYPTIFVPIVLTAGTYSMSFISDRSVITRLQLVDSDNSYYNYGEFSRVAQGDKYYYTKTFTFSLSKIDGKLLVESQVPQNESMSVSQVQFEVGSKATSYEPYFPSNKMLEEENSQQSTEMMDIKMLGWSVPRECPVQNEVNGNQFVQKVGRIDLGSFSYQREQKESAPDEYKFVSISNAPISNNNVFCYKYVVGDVNAKGSDKVISMGQYINIVDSFYTDASAFKSAMQGQYLYYELATPITTTIDGNEEVVEIVEVVNTLRKETTINLLNPTLETTTKNGVTCTNNGDGTYTLNGTASADANFFLQGRYENQTPIINKVGRFKLVPLSGTYVNLRVQIYHNVTALTVTDNIVTVTQDTLITLFNVQTVEGVTYNNEIIKPMLTTNLSATYDDFVPYTGDTGSLNGDVADLRDDVDNLEKEVVTKKLRLTDGTEDDYDRYIEPILGSNKILIPPIVVNGTSSTPGEEVSRNNYSYAPRDMVKLDILDTEITSSVTQNGITLTYKDKSSGGNYKCYSASGTATADTEIPLYSVSNPKSDRLYFTVNNVRKMSSDEYYIRIADTAGDETTIGSDGSGEVTTYLSTHSGKVTVSLMVKSGKTVKHHLINVKCGYSPSDCVSDFSASKYSDTIDNVIDAIIDLNSRLKALENK